MRIFSKGEKTIVYANNDDMLPARLIVVTANEKFDEKEFRRELLIDKLWCTSDDFLNTTYSPVSGKHYKDMNLDEFSKHARLTIEQFTNVAIEVIRI